MCVCVWYGICVPCGRNHSRHFNNSNASFELWMHVRVRFGLVFVANDNGRFSYMLRAAWTHLAWRCLLDTIIDISRRILPLLWYAAFISRMSKGSRLSRVRNRMIYGRTMSAAATTITTIIKTTTRTLRWRQSSVRLLTSGGCQSWARRRRK